MKLGVAMNFPHNNPNGWALAHKEAGLSAVVFPCDSSADVSLIDAYAEACKEHDLTIAEVGVWKNPLSLHEAERKENYEFCKRQLELAEYIGAVCCVNIVGAKGEVWDGGYADNYSEKTYDEIVTSVQKLIDSVKPQNTFYALEPMPWMHPDSPEDYLKLMQDIDRKAFGVHMDIINMISDPKRYFFNEEFTDHTFSLLGPYIKSCHVKDVLLERHLTLSLKEVPCGQGGFNIGHYLRQIDRINKDLPVIIEHLSREEEYRKAIAYIRTLQ